MLQASAYPSIESVPEELRKLDGACGPISVWLVLSRHGINAEPNDILRLCGYNEARGTFIVCMAEALQRLGLNVSFHSDPDPTPQADEVAAYRHVGVEPPKSVARLLESVRAGASVIVSYVALGGEGHFSPLAGARAKKLLLPYSLSGYMLRSEFLKRWRAPGIFRQTIVAT
jgi:hypothetical protein